MNLKKFKRYPLTFGPTPIEYLPRLTKAIGADVEIYAKRDDCNSGLAMGGNKLRKLEYIWSYYGIATDAAIMDQGSVIEVISQKTMQELYDNKDNFPSYKINHSLPIYLIDKSSITRVVYNDLKIDTEDIIHDILLLAK